MMALFSHPDNAMLIVCTQLACCVAKHGSFPHFPHVSFQMSRQGGPLLGGKDPLMGTKAGGYCLGDVRNNNGIHTHTDWTVVTC